MDETKYQVAFELIMKAGNAKSSSLMAIDMAKVFDFEGANKHLEEAENEMREAHAMQIGMIQQEAQGNPVDVNIILVHAQDHMTMAVMAKDIAERFVELYETIQELKQK
ncbi:MAG: phosphotransferase system lactose/cellobiose-specific subunit [Clostridiales bacterium]|nr:phosphotransferase system lactose/cellobiose-specific subunit [Clostridiales bacterium]